MIYLDHAATTPLFPEAADIMDLCAREEYANPSSLYPPAYRAKKLMNDSRAYLAGYINAQSDEIIFTSGGTESNSLALRYGALSSKKGKHIVISAIEHSSALDAALSLRREGFCVSLIPCERSGVILPEAVKTALRSDTALISVQYANNETGVLQPVEAIGAIAHEYGIPFHCDMVAAFGHTSIDVAKEHIDIASVSAHKAYAPKGVGLLYLKNGTPFKAEKRGAQERGIRPGTENVPAIAGFARAVECLSCSRAEGEDASLRDAMQAVLTRRFPGCTVNGDGAARLPGYLSITLPGVPAERLIFALSQAGIYISARSACSSGDPSPSHVLLAMGLSAKEAACTVRIVIGRENTMDEVLFAANAIADEAEKLVSS